MLFDESPLCPLLVSTSDKEACNKLDADTSAKLKLRDEAEGVSGDQVASKLQCIVSHHTTDKVPVAENALHILMCIDNPKDWTELYQVPIPPIGSDTEFFEFLHREFKSRQSVVSWLTLRGVISLSLKRFAVYPGGIVKVHSHDKYCHIPECVCFPPRERVMAGEYVCSPCPVETPKDYPPIPRNRLITYFRKKQQPAHTRFLFEQIPKRVGVLPVPTTKQVELGWGLHFEQGWDWEAVMIVVSVLASVVLVLLVVWDKAFGYTPSSSIYASLAAIIATGILGYTAVRNP